MYILVLLRWSDIFKVFFAIFLNDSLLLSSYQNSILQVFTDNNLQGRRGTKALFI